MSEATSSRASRGGSALVALLEEVTRERGRMEGELDAALVAIGREEAHSRRSIEEGHRRLSALRDVRREYEDRRTNLGSTMLQREWEAVRDGLGRDAERFAARASLLADAVASRESAMNAELAEPELQGALSEYLRFNEAAPVLAAMPADYREAIVAQHRQVARRLEPYITAANAPPPALAVPPTGVGVIASTDPADGRTEALVLVLPVPHQAYTQWMTRPEDLTSLFAYRMVAAVFELLASLGAADAPVRYVDVHGFLGIQVWLGDHETGFDLRERTMEHVARAADEAPELRAAGIELYTVWLRPELVGEEPAP